MTLPSVPDASAHGGCLCCVTSSEESAGALCLQLQQLSIPCRVLVTSCCKQILIIGLHLQLCPMCTGPCCALQQVLQQRAPEGALPPAQGHVPHGGTPHRGTHTDHGRGTTQVIRRRHQVDPGCCHVCQAQPAICGPTGRQHIQHDQQHSLLQGLLQAPGAAASWHTPRLLP